jgi:hypothetical protein
MALCLDQKNDGSLLNTDIDELKRAQLRMSRQPVCPGERVLWIRCVVGQPWFDNGFRSSVARKAALQRVIGVNMLVDVVQIMKSKRKLDLWGFQVIISSTTKASVPYLCEKKLLVVTRPSTGGGATFVVETGSHPAFASHVVEVRVSVPQYPSEIKVLVDKLIESMQPLASSARQGTKGDEDNVYLMALKGLMVWTVPSNPRKDVKCLLAVSMLKGTIALLRFGHGFDRWANVNPLCGADGQDKMFSGVVIDMFDQVSFNRLSLQTFVKDGKPGFLN